MALEVSEAVEVSEVQEAKAVSEVWNFFELLPRKHLIEGGYLPS